MILPSSASGIRSHIDDRGKIRFVAGEDLIPNEEDDSLRSWPQRVESILCRDVETVRIVAAVKFTILDLISVSEAGVPPFAWSLTSRDRSDQMRPCVVSGLYQGVTQRVIPKRPTVGGYRFR